MRRKDKEITDKRVLETILEEALVCRVGMCRDNEPYVVPMNFAYQDGCIYLHSAREGKKLDILRENPRICFETEVKTELLPSENPCSWTMRYQSVIGWGRAEFITDLKEKVEVLNIIIRKYAGEEKKFPEEKMDKIELIRIRIDSMTGKRSG